MQPNQYGGYLELNPLYRKQNNMKIILKEYDENLHNDEDIHTKEIP